MPTTSPYGTFSENESSPARAIAIDQYIDVLPDAQDDRLPLEILKLISSLLEPEDRKKMEQLNRSFFILINNPQFLNNQAFKSNFLQQLSNPELEHSLAAFLRFKKNLEYSRHYKIWIPFLLPFSLFVVMGSLSIYLLILASENEFTVTCLDLFQSRLADISCLAKEGLSGPNNFCKDIELSHDYTITNVTLSECQKLLANFLNERTLFVLKLVPGSVGTLLSILGLLAISHDFTTKYHWPLNTYSNTLQEEFESVRGILTQQEVCTDNDASRLVDRGIKQIRLHQVKKSIYEGVNPLFFKRFEEKEEQNTPSFSLRNLAKTCAIL